MRDSLILSKMPDSAAGLASSSSVRAERPGISELARGLVAPVAAILTFVAVLYSFQAYYIVYDGGGSFGFFLRILASTLYYYWFFLVPALVVKELSVRIPLQRDSIIAWSSIHLVTMICLVAFHQITSHWIDRVVTGASGPESLFGILFNNPAVWGDVAAYILFVLGFYMVEYRSRSQRDEIEYAQMETELAKARLGGLRSRTHPRFFFAALDATISRVCDRDWKEAGMLLSSLSDFLRETLYSAEGEETTVAEELSFLRRYVAVLRLMTNRGLTLVEEMDVAAASAALPCLVIRPVFDELVGSTLPDPGYEIRFVARRSDASLHIAFKMRREPGSPAEFPTESLLNTIQMVTARLEKKCGPGKKYCRLGKTDGYEEAHITIPVVGPGSGIVQQLEQD